jgi:beta-phosphoglucomutase
VTLSEGEKDGYLVEKNEQYLSYIEKMDQTEILPGIKELLLYLRGRGVKFALGSASKNARLILETLDLLDLFDAIVDGNDVSTAKPDPEVFLIAAEKLGAEPGDCIVVEDAQAGVQAALAAGMTCIGIGSPEVLGEADYVFSGTEELTTELIEKILD